MESSSSANEVTQGAPAFFSYHCFFHEPLRAILKCLGFETITQENLKPKDDDKVKNEATETDPPPSTTDTEVDPPSTTLEDAAPIVLFRAPPRPPVSSGSPPQIG